MAGVTLSDVEKLSREEKVRLLEMIVESLSREDLEAIPDWESRLIEQRMAEFRANPSGGRPWSEVSKDLRRA